MQNNLFVTRRITLSCVLIHRAFILKERTFAVKMNSMMVHTGPHYLPSHPKATQIY